MRGVFGGGQVGVQRHDGRALARKCHAAGAADAPASGRCAGASHQRDLARQARVGAARRHADSPPSCWCVLPRPT
ncbi:hypothetical protein G6F62_015303 [Rhizopus arrhizus]|nr:hypothetical protein G6F62_015303 [Rhizopus arrhizus]